MSNFGILSSSPSLHRLQETMYQKTDQQTKMKATAENFEATYLNTMFSQMFAGLDHDAIGEGGQAEETWRSMLVNEYSKSVAKAGGIGLGKEVYHELVRLQERRVQ